MSDQEEESPKQIKESIVFVEEDDDIGEAVKVMCDKKIGSVLVTDTEGQVVGIITDTDIVRKFTLLDVDDKLDRKVKTFMTRPVHFVQLKTMREDIEKLYLEFRMRHFPILQGEDNHRDNVFGIVSISDLYETMLRKEVRKRGSEEPEEEILVPLSILTKSEDLYQKHHTAFSSLSYKVSRIDDLAQHIMSMDKTPPALVFDMDGFTTKELQNHIIIAKKYPGKMVMITSNPNLVSLFRQYLNKEKQAIAFKPLDIGYINWFLNQEV